MERIDPEIQVGEILQPFVAHARLCRQHDIGSNKKKFFEEQYKSWLYCSDDVVKAVNAMIANVIDAEGAQMDGRKVVGDIVVAMRKDLLGKTALSYKDFRYTDVIEDGPKNR